MTTTQETPDGDKIPGIRWVPWPIAKTVELMKAAGHNWFASMIDKEKISDEDWRALGYPGGLKRISINGEIWVTARAATEEEASICGKVLEAAGDTREEKESACDLWEPET
jgi:hypothetical protein